MAVQPFIDDTYFFDELAIGQLETVHESLSRMIVKHQEKYLRLVLGDSLYEDFMTGLDTPPIAAKWTTLKNKIVNTEKKESPITNYVYYFYQQKQMSITVGTGESKPHIVNGELISSVDKQVFAWNEMVRRNRSLIEWLRANATDYPSQDYNWSCDRSELFEFKNSFNL